MKKTATKEIVTPEVVYDVATWKGDKFKPQIIQCPQPHEGLDAAGRILFFHALSMEACKASISAALFTALELYRQKLSHPGTFEAWCEMNLKHGSIKLSRPTVYRYLKLLGKTVGKNVNIDDLAHDTSKNQIEAVSTFTKYTKFSSLNELYSSEGIVSKTTMGGSRVKEAEANGKKVGRPRKDEMREAVHGAITDPARCFEDVDGHLTSIYEICVTKNGFGVMSREDLKKAINTLKLLLTKANEVNRVGDK